MLPKNEVETFPTAFDVKLVKVDHVPKAMGKESTKKCLKRQSPKIIKIHVFGPRVLKRFQWPPHATLNKDPFIIP